MKAKEYPKYVKTFDGYIGIFQYLDFGKFPVYRFPGGERVADDVEIKNGSNDREKLMNKEDQTPFITAGGE